VDSLTTVGEIKAVTASVFTGCRPLTMIYRATGNWQLSASRSYTERTGLVEDSYGEGQWVMMKY
jgi:hypothetical protein